LSGYQYDIQYHCSEDHANCDLLSRLPIKSNENNDECKDQDVYYSEVMDEHPISNHDIAMITSTDPVLSKVYDYTMNGWPNYVQEPELQA
jgi:hypothetical protein